MEQLNRNEAAAFLKYHRRVQLHLIPNADIQDFLSASGKLQRLAVGRPA